MSKKVMKGKPCLDKQVVLRATRALQQSANSREVVDLIAELMPKRNNGTEPVRGAAGVPEPKNHTGKKIEVIRDNEEKTNVVRNVSRRLARQVIPKTKHKYDADKTLNLDKRVGKAFENHVINGYDDHEEKLARSRRHWNSTHSCPHADMRHRQAGRRCSVWPKSKKPKLATSRRRRQGVSSEGPRGRRGAVRPAPQDGKDEHSDLIAFWNDGLEQFKMVSEGKVKNKVSRPRHRSNTTRRLRRRK